MYQGIWSLKGWRSEHEREKTVPGTVSCSSTTESAPSLDLADLVDRVAWSALLKTLETRGSLTGLLNYLEWTITRRAVAEYGGNKSRAAKVLGRTYRWLRKLESEMTGPQSPGHNPSDES